MKKTLLGLFLLTMFMGSGPGLHLINPALDDPAESFTVFGLPRIYAWGLFWYAVQLAVILKAYFTYWKEEDV